LNNNPRISTTDLTGTQGSTSGDCTSIFGGTSAAAPMVAGSVAIILDVNPNLHWLDVQGVLAYSSDRVSSSDSDWVKNGAGLYHSHKYGFGKINVTRAADTARNWINLPAEKNWVSSIISINKSPVQLISTIQVPENLTVTWAEVVFTANVAHRGDLTIILKSPFGTQSILAEKHGDTNSNFNAWRFTTVRNWGESSKGTWTLQTSTYATLQQGTVVSWQLYVFGY